MPVADVGKALRTKLLSYSDISDMVSTRIYPDALAQGAALPAITYYKISTLSEHTLSDITQLAHARFQIDCYATTREQANDLAHKIRKSGIFGFRGTVSSIVFCGLEMDTGYSYEQEPPTDGNQEHRYITSFDLMAHYQEAP